MATLHHVVLLHQVKPSTKNLPPSSVAKPVDNLWTGPLLPYSINPAYNPQNHRSYSFSAGESQGLRNSGNGSSATMQTAIAEEAISDEPQLPSSASFTSAMRRMSTPLTARSPWGPLQGMQHQGFMDMELSSSRPILPSSPTGLSRVRERPLPYENYGLPTSRDGSSKPGSPEWSQPNSYAQALPLQDTHYIPPRVRPNSRGITRAETWDSRIGNRGPRDWESSFH